MIFYNSNKIFHVGKVTRFNQEVFFCKSKKKKLISNKEDN